MVVEKVDRVEAEPLERGLDRAAEVSRRAARDAPVARHLHAELRREDDLVAAARERGPEEALALAAAVDICGVEEGDPRGQRRIDDDPGRSLIEAPSEVVAAEADARDLQIGAAEGGGDHRPIVEIPDSG